jgi:hypothetical protein
MNAFETTTAKDILAAIQTQKDAIHKAKKDLPRAANMEVINKKEYDSLHRKELQLEKIEEFVFNVARKR